MKYFTLLSLLIVINSTAFTQNYSNLADIPLDDSIQCKKAEAKVLECSDYLLSKPCFEDLNSVKASQFLLRWMGQTPDYAFGFDNNLYKAIKSDLMLMARYLACQSKVAINEKPKSYDKEFQFNYIKMFLEYCENSKNEVKITGKIKKLIEAKNAGKLMEEI